MIPTKKKVIKVEIDNGGESFFSDTVTVSHNPKKFVIDFQQSTPRFTKVGSELDQKMVIFHKTIILDPEVAKDFSRILAENVRSYEERFGDIKTAKQKNKKEKDLSYASYIG